MDLAAARQEGFVPKHLSVNDGRNITKRLLSVVGIITTFGRKKNRDAIRKAWMPTGKNYLFVVFSLARLMRHGLLLSYSVARLVIYLSKGCNAD